MYDWTDEFTQDQLRLIKFVHELDAEQYETVLIELGVVARDTAKSGAENAKWDDIAEHIADATTLVRERTGS